ncbi:delta 1-pyrroline-5-carboxylate dehydrogenase [Psychrobacter sp. PL15]|uniref:1-pyrroline-5-carboxylate dehydrogenase n=1 Tax=unclassified Psychrobacter TaxID=196806 RepID=UPI001AEA565F|nr:1-pyrroline-5-carboxylate dehydrogenase [Psychrobacter sp. PL15]MEC5210479.1 delta 1-pyrroline-5-carboxylate dehydrogenase [Psychrobacter sp. PL15]
MAIEFKKNHAQACEAWRLLSAVNRAAHLEAAIPKLALLTGDANKARRLFKHLLSFAPTLDEVHRMTGATGESNDLYVTARGKTMVIGGESAKTMAVLGQLIAALVTGNEVILHCPSQDEMCIEAVKVLYETGIDNDVISIANDSQTVTLLYIDRLAQVAVAGSPAEVQAVSQELANTDGILTQVIAVTDMGGLSDMLTPDYLYHFTTERVRTINTTAIGGNASLLELGTE